MDIGDFVIRWFKNADKIDSRQELLEEIEEESVDCESVSDENIE